jgi:hypothetical protein
MVSNMGRVHASTITRCSIARSSRCVCLRHLIRSQNAKTSSMVRGLSEEEQDSNPDRWCSHLAWREA